MKDKCETRIGLAATCLAILYFITIDFALLKSTKSQMLILTKYSCLVGVGITLIRCNDKFVSVKYCNVDIDMCLQTLYHMMIKHRPVLHYCGESVVI